MQTLKAINEAFAAIRRKRFYILYPMVCDIIFVYILGFVLSGLMAKLSEYVYVMGIIINTRVGELTQNYAASASVMQIILEEPQLKQAFLGFLSVLLVIFISFYLLYCFFQSISWKLAFDFTKEKISQSHYMKRFFLVNIFWITLFFIYKILDYLLFLNARIKGGNEQSVDVFFFIILIIAFYFATISYVLITKYPAWKAIKKSFVIGIKKLHKISLNYFIILLIILFFNLIVFYLTKVHFILTLLFVIIIAVPSLTFMRVLVVKGVGKQSS